MSTVAIVGAGPIGSATAHRLAQRSRVSRIVLIDTNHNAASGKALDIAQSGPVENFDTNLSATSDILAAVGAEVIVVADDLAAGEWHGDRALSMIGRLVTSGTAAAFVFAGPSQLSAIEASYRELSIPANRLVGTAPSALVGAVQALAGLELNLASVEVTIVGRPPSLVIGWSTATAAGALLTDRVSAHRLVAISDALPKLWPPGPLALGSSTARVVEALVAGSRRLHSALTVLDGDLGARGRAVMLPLALGNRRVLSHVVPSLSPQERTEMMNGV